MDAVSHGSGATNANGRSDGMMQEISKVEEEIRRRLPIGWSTSLATLRREFVEGRGYSEGAVQRALNILVRRDVVNLRNAGGTIVRVGV